MYYLVFIIGVILSVINDRKRISLYILTTIIAIMAFMRFGVGADYFSYQFLYSRLQEGILLEWKYGLDYQETLFRLIGAFLKGIGFSYQQYLILFAAINIWYVVKTVKEFSKNPTLSLLLYFSFHYVVWTLSGLRQGITIAVGIYYLLKTIKTDKKFRFFIIVIMLSFIHSSAIILIPILYLSKLNFKKKNLMIFSLFSVFISFLPLGYLIQKMPWLPLYNRVLPYLDTSLTINLIDFQSFVRILFLIFVFYFYDRLVKEDQMAKSILHIYIISLIIYFLLNFSELAAARISIYGRYLDILIFVNILYLYKERLSRLLFVYALIIFSMFHLHKDLVSIDRVEYDTILVPYTNIINKDNYNYKSSRYPELN